MAGWRDEIAQLLGRSVDLDEMTPQEREKALLTAYRESLKECVPAGREAYRPRTAYVRVLHKLHQRTHYHLVYLTSHPLGIVKFMGASEKVDIVQARVRTAKRLDARMKREGTPDLFSNQASETRGLGRSDAEEVCNFWRDYLSRGERRVDTAAFADILESTDWFPRELQAGLKSLIQSGEVVNVDSGGARRTSRPLHFEKAGERLRLGRPSIS
jgi:hypothetical protein